MTVTHQEAIPCGWPGGCRAKTRDSSGLCHHHRGFSPSIWADDGRMVRNGRLFSTIKLSMDDESNYQDLMEAASESMANQPKMIIHPKRNNVAIVTNIDDDQFPINNQMLQLPYENDQIALVPNEGTGDIFVVIKDEQSAVPILTSVRYGVDQFMAYKHAPRYGLFEGTAEEYDDAFEAIAQLDLGSGSDSKLVLMNAKDSQNELFRIKPHDISRPEIAGSLKPQFPVVDESGYIVNQYKVDEIVTSDDQPVSQDQEGVILSLVGVRNIVESRGVYNPTNGKLYLPRGWTDI